MDKQTDKYKSWIVDIFNKTADTYGTVGPQYFQYFGNALVEHAAIRNRESVLDVACGTGAVLFAAKSRVGPSAHVTGIDISPEMVAKAKEEAYRRRLKNVDVFKMDAEALNFPDAYFDCVLCGFGLFFIPRLNVALGEMKRVLKPGGRLAVSTFGERDPRWRKVREQLGFVKDNPVIGQGEITHSLNTAEKLEKALSDAGFLKVSVLAAEKEFYYRTLDEWWKSLWTHGCRGILEAMDEKSQEQLRKKCFSLIKKEGFKEVIPEFIQVLHAVGIKQELQENESQ